jgi:hypothetical protein
MLSIEVELKKERAERDAGKVEGSLTSRMPFGEEKDIVALKNQMANTSKQNKKATHL